MQVVVHQAAYSSSIHQLSFARATTADLHLAGITRLLTSFP